MIFLGIILMLLFEKDLYLKSYINITSIVNFIENI